MAGLDTRHAKALAALTVAVVAAGLFVAFWTPSAPTTGADAAAPAPAVTTDKAGPEGVKVPSRARPSSKTGESRTALTPLPADKVMLDQILLADQFGKLVARAHNDPAFAYTLAAALQQCLNRDRVYRAQLRMVAERSPAEGEKSLEAADKAFAKCRGLTSAQLGERLRLMELAARAGVLEAQVAYPRVVESALQDRSAIRQPNAVDEYRVNAEAFIQAAARTGNIEGLYAAYKLYSDGNLVQPDLVRAYRYAQAFARARPGPASQRTLTWLASRMTPDELRRAQSGG